MDLTLLQIQVQNLLNLKATDSPLISCYLNLSPRTSFWSNVLEQRIQALRSGIDRKSLGDFHEAMASVLMWSQTAIRASSRGAVVFSRGGSSPFFLGFQFRVPLPDWVSVSMLPSIYPLVEMMDTYHRYVVMICSEKNMRILEINLGDVTQQTTAELENIDQGAIRRKNPAKHESHKRERVHQFVRERIRFLDQVVSGGAYTHLILAGRPRVTALIRKELPARLESKLVETIDLSTSDPEVIAKTLETFARKEEQESQAMARILSEEIHKGRLAVSGTVATFKALRLRQADMLILTKDYGVETAWCCPICMHVETELAKKRECIECGSHFEKQAINLKEEMVRLAKQTACKVEVVNDSEPLRELGGIGCLLRYALPEHQPLAH